MNPGRGNSDYLNKTTLTVMYDGKNSYADVLRNMKNNFKSVDCLLDCKISDFTSKGYPTGSLMLEKLNKSGYCSWIGHGEPSSVACSGARYNDKDQKNTGSSQWEYIKALNSYSYNEDHTKAQITIKNICNDNGIDQLTNYDSPSVVYTLACTTCPFDVYYGEIIYDLPHTVASSYTVGGSYGGVAYLGNTRVGYFGTSSQLEVLFLKNLINNPKIGVAEALSKSNYNATNYIIKHVKNAHNLIGDPEFEIWKCQPSTRNVIVTWNDKDISVQGEDVIGSKVIINNGEGKVRGCTVTKSQGVGYSGGGKMEAAGVYKTGYLPTVIVDCYDDQLKDCTKKFVVRNVELGCYEYKSVSIGSGAHVDIRAVDSIDSGAGLSISNDGELILRCDKQVSLSGSSVNNGGTLTVKGEKVVLSNGFSVKAGGSLSINDI